MDPTLAGLFNLVAAHPAHDPGEAESIAQVLAFLKATPAPFSRGTLAGHITGSAVVLDGTGRALLLHHARLDRWLQPGGHMEPLESDPSESALREAREESGLADLILDEDASGVPLLLDVDVHPIPLNTKRAEPAHLHHDLCYVARTATPQLAAIDREESHALRWVTPQEVASLVLDDSTRRRLEKAFRSPPPRHFTR